MLKRNWNWRNCRLFCHVFVIGEISIGKGADPQLPFLLVTLMLQVRKTKKVLASFLQCFWRFSTKFQLFKKIVLSSSRGQGNFRGLEASRPRPRTSKCVLEYSTSVNNPNPKCKLSLNSDNSLLTNSNVCDLWQSKYCGNNDRLSSNSNAGFKTNRFENCRHNNNVNNSKLYFLVNIDSCANFVVLVTRVSNRFK